jgi:chromosome segregation protein
MVHIKCVELSHFKSFGGTTAVPLLPGFTVVSGPNGSGKSNILDALLFALGLASSKGMRAERLPDLVNHKQASQRNTSEVSVSVTFDLTDWTDERELIEGEIDPLIQADEWMVTRRLRVTKGGNYSSTYYMNGEPCTATELHEQLRRLRIYPEGYNIVLQGDVTRIITMNARERREIIDELAGVAEFDRKIERVRHTLEEVREREERYHIIEQELARSLERLAADRVKAEKYQKLRAKIQEKQQWEAVLIWRSLQQQIEHLTAQITAGETEKVQLQQHLESLATQINSQSCELDELNSRVKALGEDEHLSATSKLATHKAKRSQLQQRQSELETNLKAAKEGRDRNVQAALEYSQQLAHLTQTKTVLETETLVALKQARENVQQTLENCRDRATEVASASEAWIAQQTALTHEINALQQTLNPQRTEQAQLAERNHQLQQKIHDQQQQLQATVTELHAQTAEQAKIQPESAQQQIQSLAQRLAILEQERSLEQDTVKRLSQEQRQKQRQLDKLEATAQAQQEAQGSYATKLILQADLPGVCGLVAQLGQVEPRYQLALETAAGSRLAQIVVEDDIVAAAGIELLKQKRGGRATFLPLSKMRPPRLESMTALTYARGFINTAVNLVTCESRYSVIFAYVFGNTVVFEDLASARPHLGKTRIVTLQGELLESSGAMTGGSQTSRSTLHFGTASAGESQEVKELRERLEEIELVLERCEFNISEKTVAIQKISQDLTEMRARERETNLRSQQLAKEIDRLSQQQSQLTQNLAQNQADCDRIQSRLQILAIEIPQQEAQLQARQQQLAELEAEQTHSEWQIIQQEIKQQEAELQNRDRELRQAEAQLQEINSQSTRLQEKIAESQQRQQEHLDSEHQIEQEQSRLAQNLVEIAQKITETEQILEQLAARLGEIKQNRDRAEKRLQALKNDQQQHIWKLQKLEDSQQERQTTLADLHQQRQAQEAELPNPLPEVPTLVIDTDDEDSEAVSFTSYADQLEQLQKSIRNAQKRLQAMEPVNMLALEEHEQTQCRLQELSEKLQTLAAERTELLLRIENFTTLRYRAFKEAFDAVNENFQAIFATLSEGDGCLDLDDPENPFAGGLNLIAHPKGKPVQRLSSMSGGEKSLTALSFIFALQRYRPSPFYAFDEVDMFLDGANVERLAKMIERQAQNAQFIVVSLRRPMIESAERTIGVTQARGAYTQVLGIKL